MSPDLLKLFYDYTFIDIVISILLLSLSIFLTFQFKYRLNLSGNITFVIFLIHHLMFPLYIAFLYKYGSDSLTYFIGFEGFIFNDFSPGQVFLNKVLFFFKFIKFNFYNVNYFFSILSLSSLLLLLKVISDFKIEDKYTFHILISFLFLPSIHFWHMGYSKDTLTFFCISIIIYEVMKSKQNFIIIIFSLLLLYLVRIHICLFIIISFFSYYFLNIKSILIRVVGLVFVLFLTQFMLSNIFIFTDLESILVFLNIFQDLYTDDPATALVSQNNIVLQIFYYLFLPNIFALKDVSLFYLILALENTFILLLFLKILNFNFFSIKKIKYYSFLIVFSFLALTILSYVTSNIGIASRQKWIFLPSLIILLSGLKYKLNYK
jgi:hypothetical protein